MTRGSVLHVVDRAFGQHRALVQHGDPGAEAAHKRHVVLDDDDRAVLREIEDQLGGLLGLAVGHAGDRLVEQQQRAVVDQQHADLEPLLLAVAQARRPAVRSARSSPMRAKVAAMRSRRFGVRRANRVPRCARLSASESSRFSNTVRFSKTVGR